MTDSLWGQAAAAEPGEAAAHLRRLWLQVRLVPLARRGSAIPAANASGANNVTSQIPGQCQPGSCGGVVLCVLFIQRGRGKNLRRELEIRSSSKH